MYVYVYSLHVHVYVNPNNWETYEFIVDDFGHSVQVTEDMLAQQKCFLYDNNHME